MLESKKYFVLYDNLCLFCGRARKIIVTLDWFHQIKTVPLYDRKQLEEASLPIPPEENLLQELHLITSDGTIHKGFYACRKIGLLLPLTSIFAVLLYLPGINLVGEKIYRTIATRKK